MIQKIATDLKIHGFSHVRGFIDLKDISNSFQEWLASAEKFDDGVIVNIPIHEMQSITERTKSLILNIATQLNISIDRDRFAYSAIRVNESHESPQLIHPFDVHRDPKHLAGGALNWHLDHFSYFLYKDHVNWLICYFPISKPQIDASNVAIVPTDVLRAHDPESSKKIEGRGAMRFRCAETDTMDWFRMRFPNESIQVGDWFAIDDFDDQSPGWKLKLDLEKHKVVPALDVGDLLIMRADVIHKTNDANCSRIAIRCDAMPSDAPKYENWFGFFTLLLKLPFCSSKRRYNLKRWIRSQWGGKLPPWFSQYF